MEYLLISLTALLASGLTFFSGFGLGTLLVPVFGLFFPIEVAISLTAIVHFLNNLFKLILTRSKLDKSMVLRFGIPALAFAFLGALVLDSLAALQPLFSYEISGKSFQVSPVKLVIALLLLFFALAEWLPRFQQLSFDQKYIPLGGVLSGFFGGLSGHQGALRSAFLLRAGLSKESFIATGIAIACLIDISRLLVYSRSLPDLSETRTFCLVLFSVGSAFLGALAGNRLVKKITLKGLKTFVSCFLVLFALALGLGLV